MVGAWVAAAVVAASPALDVRVLSPLIKVRPGAIPAGASHAFIHAARGECEAVQLAVAPPARIDRIETGSLPGFAPTVLRVAYVPVTTPSNSEGKAGSW